MGPGEPVKPTLNRRGLLGGGAAVALALAGCGPAAPPLAGGWVGAGHARGHRLREGKSGALPAPAVQKRAQVLIVGAGIAGLAAARAFSRAGVADVHLLELEDRPGGNSRGHRMAGIACPLGAHYLPLPGPAAREVSDWLFELGLLKTHLGRTVADERHLCHSPQERLFIDGAWAEGLLPPAEPGSAAMAAYRRFARRVAEVQKLGFALPSQRAPWTPAHAALDAVTFDHWLAREGLQEPRLRWYLDYCCRDDYGAGSAVVSAWAGLHYFASRHGFHAPGDEEGEREPVFTWPEGNAWLAERLAAPFATHSAGRLHTGRTVLRVAEARHAVSVLAWDEAAGQAEQWTADTVVLALPLFVAARLVENPSDALKSAAALLPQAPWLVANLHIDRPLLPRVGAPASWDNVIHGSAGLGYVDAGHQSLSPTAGPTVLTAYRALPLAARASLLADDWPVWAGRVLADLGTVHPDLPRRLQRIDLMRYGHAMAVPAPGVRGSPALAALRAQRGRLRFAHADLAGYSVFEEAFTLGMAVG
jgi:monoamine oxidase